MASPQVLVCERVQGRNYLGGDQDLTKASTAITKGYLLSKDTNGYVVHANSGDRILGRALQSKSASDTSTTPILIDYFRHTDVFSLAVNTGTPAQSNEGKDYDVSSSNGVNLSSTTNKDITVLRYLPNDASHVLVTFTKTYF